MKKKKSQNRDNPSVCTRCGKNKPVKGKKRCEECAKYAREDQKQRYYRRRKLGLCAKCDNPPEPGKTMCKRHLRQTRENTDRFLQDEESYARVRRQSVKRYRRLKRAGLCVICTRPTSGYVRCDVCRKRYSKGGSK